MYHVHKKMIHHSFDSLSIVLTNVRRIETGLNKITVSISRIIEYLPFLSMPLNPIFAIIFYFKFVHFLNKKNKRSLTSIGSPFSS